MKVKEEIIKIEQALVSAEQYQGGIDPLCLKLPGMSGIKTRYFLNNLLKLFSGRYLEIGTWAGSTFCSALNNNTTINNCVAIDNWSEFGDPKEQFIRHTNALVPKAIDYTLLEKDCFFVAKEELQIEEHGKFKVYLYDGGHKRVEQKLALTYFYEFLEDDFVFLCDDWNWEKDVEAGTRDAFEELGMTVHKEWVMKTPNNIDNDHSGWWNGYFCALCSKNKRSENDNG